MRELEWKWSYFPWLDAPDKQHESAVNAGYVKVVLKSEADKVIAELKDKLQNVSSLLKETREWLVESQKLHKKCADNAVKIIRYNKYKRCLEMAKICERKRIDAANYRIPRETWEFYDKWHRRWRKLAEKFKPNNDVNNGNK